MLQNAVESTDLSKLSSLSKDDSWTVFTQIIGEDIKGLDSELLEVGREIVNKCGGVPLAIKVLANVLRGKTRIEQWKAVRDSNLLDAEDKEHRVLASLMLSYSHLPSHLKRCFTICSLFPKGLPLDKQQLVDQWIAHNVISLTHGYNCLEDVGDECFNSLVQVSFLQDVKEYFGRVCCEMHDLLHDLARCKQFHKIPQILLPDSIGDCNMLSSIYLCQCMELAALSNSIGRNKKLRVLKLDHTKIKELPVVITKLRNLQCLSLRNCYRLVELPKGIGNLDKLQFLNLEYCVQLVELPKEINNLEKLQVLNLENRGELVNLPEGTSKLEKLQVLNLEGCRKLVELPDGIVKFERLQVLNLKDCEELRGMPIELANVGRNSEGLIIRGISHVLEKDDAHKACLKEKTNLQRLKLEWKMRQKGEVNTEFFFNEKVDTMLEEAVLDGLEPPAGIKELEICGYSGEKYAWWMQNQVVGTEVKGQACFQFLRAMKLSDFQGLKHLQGLVELPCLEELELHKMPSLESISCGPFPSLGIKCLTTLKKLVIKKCPDLARRSEEGKGKDWHLISHILDVWID
ncbi:putative disease resistance protein RGA1 [Panicum virgatum]|uniref:putative disease resistance protein RGA1 n=1 Tax=Panicum virgatum TaxID=38727 RepID=UPI0019D4F320|nr:putative disease resistance protein RGA1 [Panicum virgatum]